MISVRRSPESKILPVSQTTTTQSKGIPRGNIVCEEQKDSRWIRCPVCDSKTRTKVYSDTAMFNFPLFCPRCKKETIIDVMQLKMAKSK